MRTADIGIWILNYSVQDWGWICDVLRTKDVEIGPGQMVKSEMDQNLPFWQNHVALKVIIRLSWELTLWFLALREQLRQNSGNRSWPYIAFFFFFNKNLSTQQKWLFDVLSEKITSKIMMTWFSRQRGNRQVYRKREQNQKENIDKRVKLNGREGLGGEGQK